MADEGRRTAGRQVIDLALSVIGEGRKEYADGALFRIAVAGARNVDIAFDTDLRAAEAAAPGAGLFPVLEGVVSHGSTVAALRHAFESAGIEFTNGSGPGCALEPILKATPAMTGVANQLL